MRSVRPRWDPRRVQTCLAVQDQMCSSGRWSFRAGTYRTTTGRAGPSEQRREGVQPSRFPRCASPSGAGALGMLSSVDYTLAHERLVGVLQLIDRWGGLYDQRWGNRPPYQEKSGLASQVDGLIDEVRSRTKLAHDVIEAMGDNQLAAKVVEYEERDTSEVTLLHRRVSRLSKRSQLFLSAKN